MAIQSTVLTSTASNIFVATNSTGNAVTVMYFCNRNGAATTFNLHVVPAGSGANVNNIAYSNKTVASGDTYIIDMEKLLLNSGDTIQASANTGNAIVATVSSIGI